MPVKHKWVVSTDKLAPSLHLSFGVFEIIEGLPTAKICQTYIRYIMIYPLLVSTIYIYKATTHGAETHSETFVLLSNDSHYFAPQPTLLWASDAFQAMCMRLKKAYILYIQ